MITFAIRLFKRLVVLVPGVIITYFAIRDLYPFINGRTPAAFALLLTYALTAYILIPLGLRILRLFVKSKHIPLYCTTPDGFASDPVNIGIIGTESELQSAMTAAGWFQADKRTIKTMFKMALSIILKHPYRNAPFSNLYLFGRSQDFGFQLPLDNNPRHRHHVRFWEASHTGDPRLLGHVAFWSKVHRPDLVRGRVLWVGAASLDTGLAVIRHNAQVTHMIHPDTNAERDLISKGLQAAGKVQRISNIKLGRPYKLRNRVLTGYLQADGVLTVCELTANPLSSTTAQ